MPAHDLDTLINDELDARLSETPADGYAAAPSIGDVRRKVVDVLKVLNVNIDKLGTIPVPQLDAIKQVVASVVNAALLVDKLIPATN